jgi:hypothetical protein
MESLSHITTSLRQLYQITPQLCKITQNYAAIMPNYTAIAAPKYAAITQQIII